MESVIPARANGGGGALHYPEEEMDGRPGRRKTGREGWREKREGKLATGGGKLYILKKQTKKRSEKKREKHTNINRLTKQKPANQKTTTTTTKPTEVPE